MEQNRRLKQRCQKTNTGEKKASAANGAGETGCPQQKNKTGLVSITLHKN